MKRKKEFVDSLTNILVKQGDVDQLEAEAMKKDFYKRSKDDFDFFLIDEFLVTKDNLLKALSTFYNLPSIDVTGIFFDHDLLINFPKEFLLENIVIPYQIDQEILTVITSNPETPDLAYKIEDLSGYNPEFLVGETQAIIDAIREFYDEPPEGYIHDLTDEDEIDSKESETGINVEELIDKDGL